MITEIVTLYDSNVWKHTRYDASMLFLGETVYNSENKFRPVVIREGRAPCCLLGVWNNLTQAESVLKSMKFKQIDKIRWERKV